MEKGYQSLYRAYSNVKNGRYKDKLDEECGVIGVYDNENNGLNSSNSLFYGLYSLQHRGQEGAGITSTDGEQIYIYKKTGLVLDVFNEEILQKLKGHISIGHTRYGVDSDGNSLENLQPMVVENEERSIALVHNGCLVNGKKIKKVLEDEGEIFKSTVDAEVILKLISKYNENYILSSIEKTMDLIDGAYALVIMTKKELIGIRDPYGLRPLCLGKLGGNYVLASESCALIGMGAEFIRDIEPGEIITISQDGIKSNQYNKKQKRASCVFEYVYFARPDSVIDGANIYEARKNAGKILAREYPVDVDMVIPVPDSAVPVALGYAEELGLTFGEGLFKNRYVGRTFIVPDQKARERTLKLKLTTLTQNVKDKKILLVDDSIVRGTTSKRIVSQLKEAGAKEVHLRISSPPVAYSCYYGIDTPDPKELVGANKSVEEIGQLVGADSLNYISLDGLLESTGLTKENFCTACFSGKYPTKI